MAVTVAMDPESPSTSLLEISEILEEGDNLDELLGLEAIDSSHPAGDHEEDIQRLLDDLVVTDAAPIAAASDTVPEEHVSPTSFLNRLTDTSSPIIARRLNETDPSTTSFPAAPNVAMSPTTLLDSLLSTRTNVLSDEPVRSIMITTAAAPMSIESIEEGSATVLSAYPPAPPLSSESVELSSLQELMHREATVESNPDAMTSTHSSDDHYAELSRMETTNASIDASFFESVKDDGTPTFDLTSGAGLVEAVDDALFEIGGDDEEEEDGFNSFMTAMEDVSSILSKTSTAGTLESMASVAADTTLEPTNESADAVPEPERRIHASFTGETPHPTIQATVSFAQSLEEHVTSDPIQVLDIPAPLPLEEDPTTPKRSGREPLTVSMGDRRPVLGERGGMPQEVSADAPSPSIVLASNSTPDATSMGETAFIQPESSNQPLDSERKVDPLYDVGSVLGSIAPLPLSSDHDTTCTGPLVSIQEKLDLSVPSLSDDVTTSPITLKTFQRNILDSEIASNEEKVHSFADVKPVAGFDGPSVEGITSSILDNVDLVSSKTETSEVYVLDEPIAPRVLGNEIVNSFRSKVDASTPVDEENAVALDGQQALVDARDLESPAEVRLSYEMKSLLQVEFPSVLESGNKKSDVSLSSASSTISHGSYSKARASSSSYVAAPTKTEDIQKRRNGNGDSLPPRSPASRNDQNDPSNSKVFAASVSKKLSHSGAVRRDQVDVERGVESKWIKQSPAINFNPKKSIFAGKLERKKNSTDSISSPGSPPEPYFESDSDDEYESSNDGSAQSSAMSMDIRNKEAGLWDMMADNGLFVEQSATNQSQYVVSLDSNRSPNLGQTVDRTDDSVTGSSIAPSETECNKINIISSKPSFKSDASLSSSALKSRGNNVALSFSQHSRGSLCSGRSRDGRQGSRGSKSFISPVGKSNQVVKTSTRLELDSASLGRFPLKPAKSPDRTTLPTTHCSSPDLYQLNEEPRQSQVPTPIKISIPDSGLPSRDGSNRPLITDALPSDILSPESLVEKYANFLSENEAIREQNAALLQEEWLSLSSLQPFDLPFRYSNSFAPLKFIGFLRWRQLLSCWKHAEITRTMVACAMFPQMDDELQSSESRGIKRSMTSSHRGWRSFETLELNGVHLQPKSTRPDTRMFKGFDADRRDNSLSAFLTQISCEPSPPSSGVLRHEVTKSGSNKIVIEDLLEIAQSSLKELSLLVKDIIAFSAMRISCPHDAELIRFSVGIKNIDSIVRKAKLKYQGDFLQVKDILRGQIVFPNEGSLVSGLVRLCQATKSSDSDRCYNVISMVRIKNLFAAGSCLGALLPSPLLTGYRHVLVNVRLDSGLLVELQFNLLHLFNALGQEGYVLHRELIDLQTALCEREKKSKLVGHFDMNEVVNDAINCNLSRVNSVSLFDDLGSTPTEPIVSPDNLSRAPSENFNEFTEMSLETKRKHLEAVAVDVHSNLTGGDIFLAILEHGSVAASRSPRDVSIFYCLYILFVFVLHRESEATVFKLGFGVNNIYDVFEYSRQCLLRCLTISNEAMSIGMTGWLEYGASSTIDRFSELPYSVLRHLIYVYGRQDKWADAECVCRALLIRCEDHLPSYHPTTLTSLVDLAIISSIIGNRKFAEKSLSRAAGRLSKRLTELENMYIKHVTSVRPTGKSDKVVVSIETGRDACFMLHSFATHLQKQLHRDMASLINPDHYIMLTNHCLVADSLSVLANCVSSAKFFLGTGSDASENYGMQYWQMAYRHYEYAFNGYVKIKKLDDPAVARAAYGIARCLREFGKTDKALQLLALVVSFKEVSVVEPNRNKSVTQSSASSERKINNGWNEPSKQSPRFLPVIASVSSVSDKLQTPKLLSSALCLWLMAVLSIDRSRNEEGREQAFGYLHAASVALQASLNEVSHMENDSTKATCIRFLAMIEDEAEQISEPIYE